MDNSVSFLEEFVDDVGLEAPVVVYMRFVLREEFVEGGAYVGHDCSCTMG